MYWQNSKGKQPCNVLTEQYRHTAEQWTGHGEWVWSEGDPGQYQSGQHHYRGRNAQQTPPLFPSMSNLSSFYTLFYSVIYNSVVWIQFQAGEVDMSPLIRLYPACYNGGIQAVNAGSPDVHINLQYKKWGEVQGKWLRTTMPTKQKYVFLNKKIGPFC